MLPPPPCMGAVCCMAGLMLWSSITGAPPLLFDFVQEKPTGAFAAAWLAAMTAAGLQTVDVGSGLADTMSIKDEEEIKNIKKAAYLISSALNNRGFKDIEETIDQEKKVKHSKLSERMEEVISQPTKINVKLKASASSSSNAQACLVPGVDSSVQRNLKIPTCSRNLCLQADVVDVAYPPIFQSGGNYDLKLSATSDDKPMHYGVVVCASGAR